MVREAIRQAAATLASVSSTPELDARVLLGFVLGRGAASVLAHDDELLPTAEAERLAALLERRLAGVPVAYLVGKQEFFGRDFLVDDRVLIPRPETELLIDTALEIIRRRQLVAPWILDIGTGSGAIAVTLQAELGGAAHVVATDISPDALAVAKQNAATHRVAIDFLLGDQYAALPPELRGHCDLVVTNPPYLEAAAVDRAADAAAVGLQHEPRLALMPTGGGAFSIIDSLVRGAGDWLRPGGNMLVEIGHDQGAAALAVAHEAFPAADVVVRKDLAGHNRLLVVELPAES